MTDTALDLERQRQGADGYADGSDNPTDEPYCGPDGRSAYSRGYRAGWAAGVEDAIERDPRNAPPPPPLVEEAVLAILADAVERTKAEAAPPPYVCSRCGAPFETARDLGADFVAGH